MRQTVDLLRRERRARVFFLTLTQSTLGTGAGYIALLLIAYERFESPWAVSLLLLVELLPAMLLGPLFGAIADRWSRKRCIVVADAVRMLAFGGIAVVDSFAATLALAALAGTGTGLATPASLAALPSVVDSVRRVPAATALYSAISDLGFTVGPAIAAILLLVGGPETIMIVNAVTFGISAVLLLRLDFGSAAVRLTGQARRTLLHEAREGMGTAMRIRPVRLVIVGSSGALFCGGLFNVAELFFATDELSAGEAGFSILVAAFGLGFISGSLVGSRGGDGPGLKRAYLAGLILFALGLLATGLAPVYAVALLTFGIAGLGNGVLLVYQRLLIQDRVPDRLQGRVFGVTDAFASWAFGIAFVAAGALLSVIDSRALILGAGALGVVVWAASAIALRREWSAPTTPEQGAQTAASEVADELATALADAQAAGDAGNGARR